MPRIGHPAKGFSTSEAKDWLWQVRALESPVEVSEYGENAPATRKQVRFNPRRPLLLLLLALGGGAAVYFFWWIAPFNVLILGVDNDETRSDLMVLASFNPRSGEVSLLSIPRDTRAGIPGRNSPEKITHAHAYGGPELSVKTVQEFLGIPLARYVEFNFKGFAALVEALGGVELEIEKRMDYEDPYQNLRIHLRPGLQRLNGDLALQYVRYRDETGDIGRIARQKKFFQALLAEIKKPSSVAKLPLLAQEAGQYSKHNLSSGEIMTLAAMGPKMSTESLKVTNLPGKPQVIQEGGWGIWYWIVDPKETKELIQKFIFAR